MKILQIHCWHRKSGGAEKYYFQVSKLLEKKGHQVAYFSMHHPDNLPTPYQKYFVNEVNFDQVQYNLKTLKALGRRFYSFEARRKIRKLIQDFKPCIAHIHSIYHYLSPSILHELKKQNIPIVMSMHDYQLISPNLFLFHNEKIDETTKKYKFYKIFLKKTKKKSYLASFLYMLQAYFHLALQIYKKNVNLYVCPSKFMANKLIEYGINKNKITFLPHFTENNNFKILDQNAKDSKKPYFLYLGRLSEEKGLKILLKTFNQLSYDLKIVGTGNFNLSKWQNCKNIEFLGFKEKAELIKLIKNAQAIILPSICYENCPLSILEAMAQGKPVIASRIGGIPELVEDGQTGYLFEPGNVEDLHQKIKLAVEHPEETKKMGERAKQIAKKVYNPQKHYQELIKIYEKLKNESKYQKIY